MSLAWIPKGVIEILRWLGYRLLWSEKQEKKVFALASWKKLAITKA
jgi:hypothetical protein